jgi:branched-chain amino acid transport system substrate-binding protein
MAEARQYPESLMPKLRGPVLIVVAALLAAAGCSAGAQPAPGTIVVGAIYPLTGPQAPGGREELDGVRTALDLAQRQGALGSRHVQLDVVSATTPDEARAAVDRLIDQDHVAAIIGTYGSTLADVAAGRADQRHVVYWETGAVADSVTIGRHYVFRTVATGSTLGRAAADFTSGVLLPASSVPPSAARVVIVAVDDVYGRSVADAEVARAAEQGLSVVDRIDYDPRTLDPEAVVGRLAGDRPDYLWDVSYIDDGIALWRSVLAHGLHLRAAVGTSSAFCMPEFGQKLGADAIGVYAADKPDGAAVPPALLQPAARDLLAAASAAYARRSSSQQMTIPAVAGFVGGWALFYNALPAVRGTVTPDALRDAALALDEPPYSSINGGGVRFARPGEPNAGQNLLAPAVVEQWQAIGTTHVVYPAPFAAARPMLATS